VLTVLTQNAGFSFGQSARIAPPLSAAAFAATACAEASRWLPHDLRFSRLDSLKLDTVIRCFNIKASATGPHSSDHTSRPAP
jgi:hypothetical protein